MPGYTVPKSAMALSASATKSLILIAPSSVADLIIPELAVSFDAAAAGQGILIESYRVATLGSPAGTSTTPQATDENRAVAANFTALTNLTTEPTSVTVLRSLYFPPNGGPFVLQFPLGREPISKASGVRYGIRATTPSGVSPNAAVWVYAEE